MEVGAIPLDQLGGAAGERPELVVDTAVELAQGAERHAVGRLVVVGQLGRATRESVERAQRERAHGRDPELRRLDGERQLVVVAVIEHEHVHAAHADPERLGAAHGQDAGDEPRAHVSPARVR
jgi:hypothetical protein